MSISAHPIASPQQAVERPPLLADFVAFMAEQGYTPTRALPDEHTRMDEHGYTLGFWRKEAAPGEQLAGQIRAHATEKKAQPAPAPTANTDRVTRKF